MYYFKIKAGEMPEMVRAEMLPPFYKIREFLGGQVERLHPDDGKGIVHLVNPNAKFKKGFERPYQKIIVCSKEVLIYGNSFICGEDEDDHLRPLSWTEAFGVGLAMNIEKRLVKKDELKKLANEIQALGNLLMQADPKKGYEVDMEITFSGSENEESGNKTTQVVLVDGCWVLVNSLYSNEIFVLLEDLGYSL